MDVIFDGRLSHEILLRHVLERIYSCQVAGSCLLRISSDQEDYSGKLLIIDSDHIVAALTTHGRHEGYEALRRLLTVASGNFAYLKVGKGDRVDLVPNLNIPVSKVAELAPNLPADVTALFDEKSLLDRVFNTDPEMRQAISPAHAAVQPESALLEPAEPAAEPALAAMAPEQSWTMLQPLLPDQPDVSDERDLIHNQLESLRAREPINSSEHTIIHPPTKRAAALSPPFLVTVVAALLFAQLLAIVFWPQVVAFFRRPVHHSADGAVDSSQGNSPVGRTNPSRTGSR